jgi:hypothetical protein
MGHIQKSDWTEVLETLKRLEEKIDALAKRQDERDAERTKVKEKGRLLPWPKS